MEEGSSLSVSVVSVHKICLFDDEWKMICNKFIELSQPMMITYIELWWIHSIKTDYLFIKCESKSPNIIWSFWQSCVANAKNMIIEFKHAWRQMDDWCDSGWIGVREVDRAFRKSERRPDTSCWTRCWKCRNIIVVLRVSNPNMPTQEERQGVRL